jgi:NAD(P)-dependent dehydrogenase (short-subunit alcohol dehydrogenase family)
VAYQLDGDDEGSIAGMVQAAVDAFGTVDLLVNNVGATALAAQDGAVLDNSAELWDETFRINMRGYFLATSTPCPTC